VARIQLCILIEVFQIKYRPDIDGLRTIAVVSVMLYHAKITVAGGHFLPGGYLGVDIFFVISGYLITTLLMTELDRTGQLSILNFYERRVRRLLPALLVVMLASLPFAWRFLLPEQLIDFSKSLVYSLLFASNFYWDHSLQQYGAESALYKPFLHTWSLAVEEQYYIVFPLLLFCIYKWGRAQLVTILSLGILVSLVYAQWMTGRDQSFSFYMMPTRLWELLAGSMCALFLLDGRFRGSDSLPGKLMPSVGLLLILGSFLSFQLDGHHPGFITVIPVLGTVLIIAFRRERDWVTRALSFPLMVYLGLLSYSLYLWHYPIFAFGRMMDMTPSIADKGLWIALTVFLSVFTYYVIEKPSRSRGFPIKILGPILLSLSLFIIFVSLYWIKADGIPSRGEYLRDLLQASKKITVFQNGVDCLSGNKGPPFPASQSCVFNYSPGAPTLVLVGDSHAASIAESVRVLAKGNQLNFMQVSEIGCPHVGGALDAYCKNRSAAITDVLKQVENPKIIYISRLPLYLEQEAFDNQEGMREPEKIFFKKGFNEKSDPGQRGLDVVTTLRSWAEAGYDLVVVYPVPEQAFHVIQSLSWHSPPITSVDQLPTLTTSYDVFKRRVASSYKALDQLHGPRIGRVYPEKLFCRQESGRCIASESERLYFAYDNHVSPLGADLIVRQVANELGLKVPDSFRQ
jgi:peptidoglycan/LPS O-acetylase OafA/YrhL|tara:strand:+ start:470 stop:2524 length:2055 start_codon:yes stop_codon:yes gene_type:complete